MRLKRAGGLAGSLDRLSSLADYFCGMKGCLKEDFLDVVFLLPLRYLHGEGGWRIFLPVENKNKHLR